ncbi:hypothetical protein O3P69_011319 [Scylla paramamosain]|uniref:Uncharacterized protein n=1 Tax=Scylla paramamosain TaxID=85552 RepID=A0AAW0SBT2_SCYPA
MKLPTATHSRFNRSTTTTTNVSAAATTTHQSSPPLPNGCRRHKVRPRGTHGRGSMDTPTLSTVGDLPRGGDNNNGCCARPNGRCRRKGAAANAVTLLIQRRGDERRPGPLGQLTPGGGGHAPRLAEVNLVRHGSSNHPVGINVESARQGSQQREEELHGTLVIIVEDLRTSTAPSSVETRTSRDACAFQQPPKRALRGAAPRLAASKRIRHGTHVPSGNLQSGPSEEQRTGTAPSSVETRTSWNACAVQQPQKRALKRSRGPAPRLAASKRIRHGMRVPSSNLKSRPSEEQSTGTAPSSVEAHTSWNVCAVQQPQKRALRGAEDRHRAWQRRNAYVMEHVCRPATSTAGGFLHCLTNE